MYCRKYRAFSRAPIIFELNREKWLGWAGCLGRRGLSAERVKAVPLTKTIRLRMFLSDASAIDSVHVSHARST